MFGREQFLDSWRPYVWHAAALRMLMGVSSALANRNFPTDTTSTSGFAVVAEVRYCFIRHCDSLHDSLCSIRSVHANRLVVAWKTLVSLGASP